MAAWIRRVVMSMTVVAALPAAAGEPLTDSVVLRAGAYLPQSSPSKLQSGSYGAGLDLEVAAGRAFLPWLAGEIGAGYLAAESDVFQDIYPGQLGIVPMKARFSLVPLTVSVKFILPGGSIEPYAFGGAGVYFASFEKRPTGALPTLSDTDTIFGFHAGAGAGWRVGERLVLGVYGRYSWAKDQFFGTDYAFNGVGLTATVAYQF